MKIDLLIFLLASFAAVSNCKAIHKKTSPKNHESKKQTIHKKQTLKSRRNYIYNDNIYGKNQFNEDTMFETNKNGAESHREV